MDELEQNLTTGIPPSPLEAIPSAPTNPFAPEEFQLNWTKNDIEQRFGFSGGRFTSVNKVFSFLIGLSLTVIFFLILIYGLEPQPGARSPRLHDFRHALAVSVLLDAHRQGRDVDACIAILSTHLGHIGPAHTYWYLTITPALADAVSERVALYYQGGNFR